MPDPDDLGGYAAASPSRSRVTVTDDHGPVIDESGEFTSGKTPKSAD